MIAYRETDKTFYIITAGEQVCTQSKGAEFVDTHLFSTDAPADFDVCQCGKFYHVGAINDKGTS